jgi:hypothetical protein
MSRPRIMTFWISLAVVAGVLTTLSACGGGTPSSPNFQITATALQPASIVPGSSGTSTVTVTPTDGFSSTVALSCEGLPTGASCTFNPSSLTGSGNSQLTVKYSGVDCAEHLLDHGGGELKFRESRRAPGAGGANQDSACGRDFSGEPHSR